MKISVIIPAFNIDSVIVRTVEAIKESYPIDQIIVVDDGSKDNTSAQAESAGALVIRHKYNLGKGAALNSASRIVTGDIICLLDGDLGASGGKFSLLLPPILSGEADVTVARFPPPPISGGFGLVKKLAAFGTYKLTGMMMSCPLSGQRAIKRKVFESIVPFAKGYGVEVAANVDIIKNGWRLKEIDINMEHNFTERDLAGFIHRGRQFYDICRVLLQKTVGD